MDATATVAVGSQLAQVAAFTTIIQNIVLAGSGLATVIIAAKGLSAWSSQLKGTSEYAKAKEVLKAVYRVRTALMRVRAPMVMQYEYPEEMTTPSGHLKPECDYDGTKAVYQNRWKPLADALGELDEQNLDAQVEWEPGFQETIVPLRQCVIETQIAVSEMLERKQTSGEPDDRSKEEKKKDRAILYARGADHEDDQLSRDVDAAVALFEDRLRPHIKR